MWTRQGRLKREKKPPLESVYWVGLDRAKELGSEKRSGIRKYLKDTPVITIILQAGTRQSAWQWTLESRSGSIDPDEWGLQARLLKTDIRK